MGALIKPPYDKHLKTIRPSLKKTFVQRVAEIMASRAAAKINFLVLFFLGKKIVKIILKKKKLLKMKKKAPSRPS